MLKITKILLTVTLTCICSLVTWGQTVTKSIISQPTVTFLEAETFFVKPGASHGIRFWANDDNRRLHIWDGLRIAPSVPRLWMRSVLKTGDGGWRWDVTQDGKWSNYASLSTAGDFWVARNITSHGQLIAKGGANINGLFKAQQDAEFYGELRSRNTARFYNLARFYSTLKIESGGQLNTAGSAIFNGSATFNQAVQFNGNVAFGTGLNLTGANLSNPTVNGILNVKNTLKFRDSQDIGQGVLDTRILNFVTPDNVAKLRFYNNNTPSYRRNAGITWWEAGTKLQITDAFYNGKISLEEGKIRQSHNDLIEFAVIGAVGQPNSTLSLSDDGVTISKDLSVGGTLQAGTYNATTIKTREVEVKSAQDPAGDGWVLAANDVGFKVARQELDNQGNLTAENTFFEITHGYNAANGPEIRLIGKVKFMSQPNAPDYVFEPDYKLLSLNELRSYIKKNKHLPGVPSAKQIEKEGFIDAVKMDYTLLEKVEELTLYTLQQDKQLKAKNKEIDALKKRLIRIEKLLNKVLENHKK